MRWICTLLFYEIIDYFEIWSCDGIFFFKELVEYGLTQILQTQHQKKSKEERFKPLYLFYRNSVYLKFQL